MGMVLLFAFRIGFPFLFLFFVSTFSQEGMQAGLTLSITLLDKQSVNGITGTLETDDD